MSRCYISLLLLTASSVISQKVLREELRLILTNMDFIQSVLSYIRCVLDIWILSVDIWFEPYFWYFQRNQSQAQAEVVSLTDALVKKSRKIVSHRKFSLIFMLFSWNCKSLCMSIFLKTRNPLFPSLGEQAKHTG